jgi:2-keto-4-pentenoate hydratase/2-oxohepta-3-ene-1,7-dioic acid hydratase in catechol pathway
MRLVTFEAGGRTGVGVRRDGAVLDTGYASMLDLIRDAGAGLERAAAASQEVSVYRILAPIPRPPKILCSGVNYASHADENPDAVMPTEPFFFSKLPSAVVGPGEPIVIPAPETQTDYEVELAMVVGKTGKGLSEPSALDATSSSRTAKSRSERDRTPSPPWGRRSSPPTSSATGRPSACRRR